MKTNPPVQTQLGFTLLEMLMVILIIAATTKIVAVSMEDFGYAARYEQTQDRLDTLRQAIIGNPKRTINGQPDISGFVKDMGRLPINLRELVSSDSFCLDPTYAVDVSNDTNFGTQALCEAAGHTWHTIAGVTGPNLFEGNLVAGWQGPYIQVNDAATSTTDDIFPDGWGNQANTETAFEHFYDYGWYWCHWDAADDGDGNNLSDDTDGTPDGFPNCNTAAITVENLSIYSLGKDGAGNVNSDGSVVCGANNFNDDCYTTVLIDDYIIDILAGISVSFRKPYSLAIGTCGFLASQAGSFATQVNCENAGGNWNGTSCSVINAASCKSVGGKWQTCQFIPDQCAAFTAGAGTTWQESCEYTENSCAASSGSWDASNNVCVVSGNACPGASCPHVTQTACNNDNGVWIKRCVFNDAISCQSSIASGGAEAVFNTTNLSSCTFSSAQCETAGGFTSAKDCYLTHAEGEGSSTRYNERSCQVGAKGTWVKHTTDNDWVYQQANLCLKVFYRDPVSSAILNTSSSSVLLDEDGLNQTILFSDFGITNIPMGINAIGIYEYDSAANSCTTNLYPSDRTQPIQVQFIPHTNLPIINW